MDQQQGNKMRIKNKMSGEGIGLAALAAVALLVGASPAEAQVSLGRAVGFAVLSAAPEAGGAVTFTDSTISGDLGSSGLPAAVVQTGGKITGTIIAPVDWQVIYDFNAAYDALAAVSCDRTLPATLADVTLSPGVYCFDAAATLTGVLTLKGPSNGVWLFKVGTGGIGALTGTSLSVVMAEGALVCNVTWRVAQAATMTTSDFKGTILAGAEITFTGGTFSGRALGKNAVTLTGVSARAC
jgi:hypothetical protein